MDCTPPGSIVQGIFQARITGVSCHSLLQGIFLTQGSKPGLLHWRQILYSLMHQGSPLIIKLNAKIRNHFEWAGDTHHCLHFFKIPRDTNLCGPLLFLIWSLNRLAFWHFFFFLITLRSVQSSSVAQSCPTLCDPMNHGRPGLPVHHQLPEFIQTHVHQVSDAIQPSHSLPTAQLNKWA